MFMRIIKAESAHVDSLAEMNKQLIEDEGHGNPMTVSQLADRMRQWLKGEYACYLAVDNDAIVAYCLYRDDGDFYYMRQLFVEREHRRKGVAAQLLDWLYENAWRDKKVRLEVLSHNQLATDFYKSYGFKIDCFRMVK